MRYSKIIFFLIAALIASVGCSRKSPQLKAILSESEAINDSVTMGEIVHIFEKDGGRTLGKQSSAILTTDYNPTKNNSIEDLFNELEMLLLNNDWELSARLKEDGTSLLFKKSIGDEIFEGTLAIDTGDTQNNVVYIRLQSQSFE